MKTSLILIKREKLWLEYNDRKSLCKSLKMESNTKDSGLEICVMESGNKDGLTELSIKVNGKIIKQKAGENSRILMGTIMKGNGKIIR